MSNDPFRRIRPLISQCQRDARVSNHGEFSLVCSLNNLKQEAARRGFSFIEILTNARGLGFNMGQTKKYCAALLAYGVCQDENTWKRLGIDRMITDMRRIENSAERDGVLSSIRRSRKARISARDFDDILEANAPDYFAERARKMQELKQRREILNRALPLLVDKIYDLGGNLRGILTLQELEMLGYVMESVEA